MNDFISAGIADLRGAIAKLEALKEAGPEVAEALAHVQRVWSDGSGWDWILSYNAELDEAPIDLLLHGEVEPVRRVLGRIEYGTAV